MDGQKAATKQMSSKKLYGSWKDQQSTAVPSLPASQRTILYANFADKERMEMTMIITVTMETNMMKQWIMEANFTS